jgi:hypothetical protein
MTPRQVRRAAERKAAKLARKAGPAPATTAAPELAPATQPAEAATAISPAKLAANQANAQLSTGPRTEAGKQISSLNALKTALTGKTVLLPTDDRAAYETLTTKLLNDFRPATPDERTLVQSLIDTTWRHQRVQNIEFAIYTKGSLEFAGQFDHLNLDARNQMIQLETFLKYEKSIRNLNTQEARLQRKLCKDLLELERLQALRHQQETEKQALLARRAAKTPPSQPNYRPVGFEFSNLPESVRNTRELAPEPALTLEQAA